MRRSFFDTMFEGGLWDFSPEYRVIEDENKNSIVFDVPGATDKDLTVVYEDGILSVEVMTSVKGYQRVFTRAWTVSSSTFDVENIAAEVENGVLTLTIPKREVAKARRIEVKAVKALTPTTA